MLQTCSTLDDVLRTYDWFEEMRSTQPVWLMCISSSLTIPFLKYDTLVTYSEKHIRSIISSR